MKWQGGKQSDNFEDRRGMSSGGKVAFGGGVGTVIIALIVYFLGGDPSQVIQQAGNNITTEQTENGSPRKLSEDEERLTAFSRTVLQSTEDVWGTILPEQTGKSYVAPKLVFYDGGTETGGCGTGLSSYGPFYCPGDQKVYLDLSFNQELQTRFGAKGEFALAYVIAHEVGHHIQNLLGTFDASGRGKGSKADQNKISVMTELQADYYAGVWAHYVNQYGDVKIDAKDIEDGMTAAEAVGDDKLQTQAQGYAVPESFTHGTSAQRKAWFQKGYQSGQIKGGDTFDDPSLR